METGDEMRNHCFLICRQPSRLNQGWEVDQAMNILGTQLSWQVNAQCWRFMGKEHQLFPFPVLVGGAFDGVHGLHHALGRYPGRKGLHLDDAESNTD
ncbi:hypothetical protein DCS_07276 [Drechmeria coniospora]|uniref:Uncharacterized protein n=1 Tax=Drechmeria coniospora TaxID=98403 RepID=A0A151GE11_DRECN|nr:hypothetical protein DCS_07276 [Drechmeria coniospora]KYK55313.1 hypothetical protein DCS_07276 [Drechmeria coniospora]